MLPAFDPLAFAADPSPPPLQRRPRSSEADGRGHSTPRAAGAGHPARDPALDSDDDFDGGMSQRVRSDTRGAPGDGALAGPASPVDVVEGVQPQLVEASPLLAAPLASDTQASPHGPDVLDFDDVEPPMAVSPAAELSPLPQSPAHQKHQGTSRATLAPLRTESAEARSPPQSLPLTASPATARHAAHESPAAPRLRYHEACATQTRSPTPAAPPQLATPQRASWQRHADAMHEAAAAAQPQPCSPVHAGNASDAATPATAEPQCLVESGMQLAAGSDDGTQRTGQDGSNRHTPVCDAPSGELTRLQLSNSAELSPVEGSLSRSPSPSAHARDGARRSSYDVAAPSSGVDASRRPQSPPAAVRAGETTASPLKQRASSPGIKSESPAAAEAHAQRVIADTGAAPAAHDQATAAADARHEASAAQHAESAAPTASQAAADAAQAARRAEREARKAEQQAKKKLRGAREASRLQLFRWDKRLSDQPLGAQRLRVWACVCRADSCRTQIAFARGSGARIDSALCM